MSAHEASPTPPAWKPLEARERRVLGVLLEKASTTPAAYPLTVNAIVAGCNQKNNRDPLTAYDDIDVEQALGTLQAHKVASEIDWLGRVPKYKHHAFEWLGVDRTEMAVMTELLLRGAQALGELRARASRMAPIEDQAALKAVVAGLLERRLVIELTPPGRGQVVSHGLYPDAELAELRGRHAGLAGQAPAEHARERAGTAPPAPPASRPDAAPAGAGAAGFAALAAEVAGLREQVDRLRARVEALESAPGGRSG